MFRLVSADDAPERPEPLGSDTLHRRIAEALDAAAAIDLRERAGELDGSREAYLRLGEEAEDAANLLLDMCDMIAGHCQRLKSLR